MLKMSNSAQSVHSNHPAEYFYRVITIGFTEEETSLKATLIFSLVLLKINSSNTQLYKPQK